MEYQVMRKYLGLGLAALILSSTAYTIAPIQLRTALQTFVFGFLEVPYNQATSPAGYTVKLETGNENRLVNGSFDSSVVAGGWDEATLGSWANETSRCLDGSCLTLDDTGINSELRQTTTFNAHEFGLPIKAEAFIYRGATDSRAMEICLDNQCQDINHGDNTYKKYEFISYAQAANVFFIRPIDGTIGGGVVVDVSVDKASLGLNDDNFGTSKDSHGIVDFIPTGSLTTNVTYTGSYYKDGEHLHATVRATFTGTNTENVQYTVNLPDGLVIDVDKITADDKQNVDEGSIFADNSAGNYAGSTVFNTTTSVRPRYFHLVSSRIAYNSVNPFNALPFTAPIAAGDAFITKFKVPIVGWTDSVGIVTQNKTLEIPKITTWEPYTPSDTQGLGVISNNTLEWRQVGENLELRGGFKTGTVTASTARLGLPTGLLLKGVGARTYGGEVTRNTANSPYRLMSVNGFAFFSFGGGASQHGDLTGTSLFGNSEQVFLTAAAPIQGWNATDPVSAVISGTFENINSSNLDMIADAIGTTAITANTAIPLFPTPHWETNNFSPTSTTIIPTHDGKFIFNGFMRAAVAFNGTLTLYNVTDAVAVAYLMQTSAATNQAAIAQIVKMEAGKTYEIRWGSSITLARMELAIIEHPDTESIIENLSKDKEECQTKRLSGSKTSTGQINELAFYKLKIGRAYSLSGKFLCQALTSTGATTKGCVFEAINGSQRVAYDNSSIQLTTSEIQDIDFPMVFPSYKFIATADSISSWIVTLNSAQIAGSEHEAMEHLTLCELPVNYIINSTRFNL